MTIQQLILTMRENAEYFNNIGLESTGSCFSDTADRLEALLAENEHLREVTKMVPRWVSAKERLPKLTNKENERIKHFGVAFAPEFIVLIKGTDAPTTIKFDGEEWLDDDGTRYRVAYWCTLPEPPSTEGVE